MSTDEIVQVPQTSEVTNINTQNPLHPGAAGVLPSTSHDIVIPPQDDPILPPGVQRRIEDKEKAAKAKAEKAEKKENRLPLTLGVLVGLATILFVIGINPSAYAKPEFDNVVSQDSQCKPHYCPCCPFFVIVSLFINVAIMLVWWALLVACQKFPYNGMLCVILLFVWVLYWIILRAKLPKYFWKPMCVALNMALLLLWFLRTRAKKCWDPVIIILMKLANAFMDTVVLGLFIIPGFLWDLYQGFKQQ